MDSIVENRIKAMLPCPQARRRAKTIAQKYGNIQREIEKITGNDTADNPEKVILRTTKR
jgi:hypothetical protein